MTAMKLNNTAGLRDCSVALDLHGGREIGHQQQDCDNTTACVSDSTEVAEPAQTTTAVNDSLFDLTCHLGDTSAL